MIELVVVFLVFFSEVEAHLLTSSEARSKHLTETEFTGAAAPQGVVGAALSLGQGVSAYDEGLQVSKRSILSAGFEALKGATEALYEKVKTAYNQGYEALCAYFSSSKEVFCEIVGKASSILSQKSFSEDTFIAALSFAADKLLLVENTRYDAELASLRTKLAANKNTSTIAPCAKELSKVAVSFIDYHIVNAKDISLEQQPIFMRKFVRNRPDGKVEPSFTGKVAGALLKNNKYLLQKCIEANVATILQNLMSTFERIQAENPHLLADVISNVCDKMDFDKTNPMTAQEEKQLFKAITKELITIILPNGLNSLKLPFIYPLDQAVGAAIEYCVPSILEGAFSQVLNATTREKVLLAATQSIKQSFELISTTRPEPKKETETEIPSKTTYVNQASFNANVAKGIRHLLNWIDKRTYDRVFKHFPFEKVLTKSGPEITAQLVKIDFSTSFAQGLEDLTKTLAGQEIKWKDLKGSFDIMAVPTIRKAVQYKLQQEIKTTVSSIHVDIRAMAKQIVESRMSKNEEKALDNLLSDSAYTRQNAKIQLAFINFGKKIRQFFLVVLFRILRLKTRIPSICNLAIDKVRELHVPYVVGSTLQRAFAVTKTSGKKKPHKHH